jgi:hypothetical protein
MSATSAMTSTGSVTTVPDCQGTAPANPEQKVAIGTVSVTIHDEQGQPVPPTDIDVQLCGLELCLAMKGDNGSYITSHAGKELTDPAFKYGGQSSTIYPFWGGSLPEGPDHDYGIVTAVKLGQPGGKLEKGATVSSEGVTVAFDPDARVERELILPEDEFRAKLFSPGAAKFPPLATGPTFDLILAMGPTEVDICPKAKLTFPNSENWPAKTAVELWLNGVKTYDHWVPYGSWAKVADATVSDDGTSVVTNAGAGIPAIGVYGLIKK